MNLGVHVIHVKGERPEIVAGLLNFIQVDVDRSKLLYECHGTGSNKEAEYVVSWD